MAKVRSVAEINERIRSGIATIMTSAELSNKLARGEKIGWEEVDIITSATCGLMSGTLAVLSFPVSGRGEFIRAQEVLLNGVPTYPGPCPNERLGIIDLIVYGTEHSKFDRNYGGGHLLRDIVANKEIEVQVKSKEGKEIKKEITRSDISYARLMGIRNCFKNYIGMINKSEKPIYSIFHVMPLRGPFKEVSVCGCGALNPLAKDPHLEVIGVGTKVLINDAVGYVTGLGTRATPEKPNLAGFADMHQMDPYYMGGFNTSEGPEVISSWAIPIPILNETVFKNACITDAKEPLPIADISDRIPFTTSDYSQVWKGTDLVVKFNSKACTINQKECKAMGLIMDGVCPVERICPVNAFTTKGAVLNRKRCFNCGACVQACKLGCFKMNMGNIEIDGKSVPITLRQSDRIRAMKLAKRLKNKILDGSFILSEKIDSLLKNAPKNG
jgi:putative methanogenesis marker 16 metalloprotein